MSFSLKITGLRKLQKSLTSLPERARKTTAVALRNTALAVVDDTYKRLIPKQFINRRPNNKYGFHIFPRYVDPKDLTVGVRSNLKFWPYQEIGGVKRPTGKKLAIPLVGARPNPKSKITKAKRPSTIMSKDGTRPGFILNTPKGPVMFRRRSKKRIIPFYALENKAKIRPRFGFYENATRITGIQFQRKFNKAFFKEFYRF